MKTIICHNSKHKPIKNSTIRLSNGILLETDAEGHATLDDSLINTNPTITINLQTRNLIKMSDFSIIIFDRGERIVKSSRKSTIEKTPSASTPSPASASNSFHTASSNGFPSPETPDSKGKGTAKTQLFKTPSNNSSSERPDLKTLNELQELYLKYCREFLKIEKSQYGNFALSADTYIEHEFSGPKDLIQTLEQELRPQVISICGKTGTGKTSWVKEQLRQWAAQESPDDWVFLVDVSRLTKTHYFTEEAYTFLDILYEECFRRLPRRINQKALQNDLATLLASESCKIVIIIDGAGNYAPEAHLVAAYRELLAQKKHRIIVNKSNAFDWAAAGIKPDAEYEIQGFRDIENTRKKYIALFFDAMVDKRFLPAAATEKKDRLLNFFKKLGPSHSEINTPIMLDLLCTFGYENNLEKKSDDHIIFMTYEKFLFYYLYTYLSKKNDSRKTLDENELPKALTKELALIEYFAFIAFTRNATLQEALIYTKKIVDAPDPSYLEEQRQLGIIYEEKKIGAQTSKSVWHFENTELQRHLANRYLISCYKNGLKQTPSDSIIRGHSWDLLAKTKTIKEFIEQKLYAKPPLSLEHAPFAFEMDGATFAAIQAALAAGDKQIEKGLHPSTASSDGASPSNQNNTGPARKTSSPNPASSFEMVSPQRSPATSGADETKPENKSWSFSNLFGSWFGAAPEKKESATKNDKKNNK